MLTKKNFNYAYNTERLEHEDQKSHEINIYTYKGRERERKELLFVAVDG